MKTKIAFLSAFLASLMLVSFAVPIIGADDIYYGPNASLMPSNGEMFGWIKDLWNLGCQSDMGFRQAGTAADHEAAEYILKKFEEFGLQEVWIEPVVDWPLWTPVDWSLDIRVEEVEEEIPCSYRPYTAFTGEEGITAEMVYVGLGMSDSDFEGAEDKIVVVDLIAPGLNADLLMMFSPWWYDPEDTLPGAKATENWPVNNLVPSYELAIAHGAAGYIGILNFLTDGMDDYYSPYTGVLTSLTGLYVSRDAGFLLKNLLVAGPVEATMVLTGDTEPGVTYNVVGVLPGETDEIILVTSHHDGWAANEGSGVSVVMALAKYFAKLPENSRQRTLMFLAVGGHFLGDIPTQSFIAQHTDLLPQIVVNINIEMIAKEYKEVDGEFVETGLVAPRGLFVSGPPFEVDPKLLSFAMEAIPKYEIDRTMVLPASGPLGPAPPGVAAWFFLAGIPIMHFIAAPPHQFTPEDTPDKVAIDQLRPATAAFVDIIMKIDTEYP